MENPLFLKKLIIGPAIVLPIQEIKLLMIFFEPILFCINKSISFCLDFRSVEIDSCTNIKPMFIRIINIPRIKNVICQ